MKSAKLLLLLTSILNTEVGISQDLTNEGTEFWCAYTEVYDHAAALFEINLSGRVPASGTVSIPGTGFSAAFTVVPGTVTNVTIPPADANITANETILNRAIHITSDNPISAFASTFHLYRSEATVLLPVASLGSNYIASSQANFSTNKSHFTVVAGASPCTVDITVSCPTESGHIAGDTWPITLNPGEIYMVQAANGAYDISGSTIKASNSTDKFAVFNGHTFANGTICLGVNKDPLYEIAFPIESFGMDHVIVKTAGQNRNSYRVIATQNGTQVYENGSLVSTLNAGQVYDALFTVECLTITANKPVGVTQHMVGSSCSLNNAADPAMVAINPNEQMYLDTATFFAVGYNGININFVNIVTRTSETALVQMNSIPVAGWIATPDPLYSYAIVPTPVGSHTITTSGCGFLAYAYGHQWAESYFYSAGCRVNSVEDSIDFQQHIGTNPNFCDIDTVEFIPYTSGGPVLSYQWDLGDGTTSTLSNPLHVYNSAGTFIVELIVEYQCEMDTIVDTISIFESPDVTGVPSTAACSGSDGSIDITVTGGTPAFSFLWSSGATSEDLTALGSGTYDVVATDAMGCLGYDTLTVVASPAITASVSTIDPVCNGGLTGSATVSSITGGVTPFSYLWSSGGTLVTETGLGAGSYDVTVTDANGCAVTINFTLSEPAAVVVTATPDTTICINGSATLSASATGGTGGFSYSWTDGVFSVPGPTVSPIIATCYDVVATDASGCVSTPATFCVDLFTSITVTLSASDICPGNAATVDATISGGLGGYSYSWTNSLGTIAATEDITTPQNVTSETYCLTVSDGCETPDENECVVVNLHDLPSVNHIFQGDCVPFTATFGGIYDPALVSSVIWNFGDGGTSTIMNPSHEYDFAGVFDIFVSVVTVNGCLMDTTILGGAEGYDVPEAQFSFSPSDKPITIEDTEVHFINQSSGGTSFSWDFADGTGASTEENPWHTFPSQGNQSYDVVLTVTTPQGCSDQTQQTIMIEEVLLYFVPNAFTPDGNNLNNEFKPVFTEGFDPYDYHLTVFNRWGEIMFESYNTAGGWDGTYSNNGLAEVGVYVWQIQFGDPNSDKKTVERGHVSLLR